MSAISTDNSPADEPSKETNLKVEPVEGGVEEMAAPQSQTVILSAAKDLSVEGGVEDVPAPQSQTVILSAAKDLSVEGGVEEMAAPQSQTVILSAAKDLSVEDGVEEMPVSQQSEDVLQGPDASSDVLSENEASVNSSPDSPTQQVDEKDGQAEGRNTDTFSMLHTLELQHTAGPETDKIQFHPDTEPIPALPPLLRPLRLKQSRVVSFILLGILILALLVPIGFAIGQGVSAYSTYGLLRNEAHNGVQHLLNVKTIFTGLRTHPTGFLDTNKLHRAQTEFAAASKNFQQLQYILGHTPLLYTVAAYFPQYIPEIETADAAGQMGIDVSAIGQELTQTALILAPTLHGSLLSSSKQPLITPETLALISSTIAYVLPRLNDILVQNSRLSIDALPISAQQRAEFAQLISALPQIQADLEEVQNLLGAAGWVLGVDGPRTYLVQTMDRSELRPTGGFTGQYGELHISGGRVGTFTLRDISLIEYADNSPTYGQLTPEQYRSWWPFPNWGLRDSNLSADFPSSASMAISRYKYEVGHSVDGVILFTPFLIEHILQIIGPINIPAYHETITAQNLEDRLHYYQQDNAGISKQIQTQPGDTSTSARKRFTSLLAQVLIDQVRHAPPDELLSIGREMLHDLKTRDLQVYFANPQVEGLLMQYGDAGQMDRSTTHDGLYIVQANLSASKNSQFVRTIIHDTVTLDANGGATHLMQLRLAYNVIGPIYGYDVYRDYVRVYIPPSSKFLWGDGFDTGKPLCGAFYAPCPQYDVYPADELVCPAGQFQPGAAPPSFADSNGGDWQPLDTIGPPTNMSSDEPGRAMFGGWVIVPKNCTMTVTLSWYVPPLSSHPYTLHVQRQAGTFPELDLTLLPTPGNCASLQTAGEHFDGIMNEDMSFILKSFKSTGQSATSCYPQPGV